MIFFPQCKTMSPISCERYLLKSYCGDVRNFDLICFFFFTFPGFVWDGATPKTSKNTTATTTTTANICSNKLLTNTYRSVSSCVCVCLCVIVAFYLCDMCIPLVPFFVVVVFVILRHCQHVHACFISGIWLPIHQTL